VQNLHETRDNSRDQEQIAQQTKGSGETDNESPDPSQDRLSPVDQSVLIEGVFTVSALKNIRGRKAGFTLLELVIVTAILGSIAGGAVLMVGQTEELAQGQISLVEVSEIREAMIQFKKDTGYLPKTGPFQLATEGGFVPVPAEGSDWFQSPANFSQLFSNPLAGTGHPLATWNPDTKRGWRGPYLTCAGEGQVSIGDDLNTDGSGSPTLGDTIDHVVGIADPFLASPDGDYFQWSRISDDAPIQRLGRPYLA